MARKITPERKERRKQIMALLHDAGINDVEGVQDLFKEMVGAVLETGWRASQMKNSVTASMITKTSRQITAETAAGGERVTDAPAGKHIRCGVSGRYTL